MKEIKLSLVVPVYNRPNEIQELLHSLTQQTYDKPYEIIIVEDGSQVSAEKVIAQYQGLLPIRYYQKENTGPGDSRNFAMKKATGNYFILVDSDCILPPHYLEYIDDYLQKNDVGVFGGADAAHEQFSPIQKAINYAMTSPLSTGGIRGSKKSITAFEPRSFNMGISAEAFGNVGGFGNIHPGEDTELSIILKQKGYRSGFIADAFVYHKRRISWEKFALQVHKFGLTRSILNKRYPSHARWVYFLPAAFVMGLLASIFLLALGYGIGLWVYVGYFILIFLHSSKITESYAIGALSVRAVFIQFWHYGLGFLYGTIIQLLKNAPTEELFPEVCFTPKEKK